MKLKRIRVALGAASLLFGLGMSQGAFQLLKVDDSALAYLVMYLVHIIGLFGFAMMLYLAARERRNDS